MPPQKVTNAELAAKIEAVEKLLKNELRHHAEDIGELQGMWKAFMAENGPWRKLDRRVGKLERLAWLFGGVAFLLTPVAAWAVVEVAKSIAASLGAGP